ncbi:hypothetical protein [Nocardia paucivorans]|uniref:hypothetical protein n=1 Tax=Nocardia paucivorans TaxID=114259 RepID=UPI0002DCC8A7|nr:hypothetical protein [Nocardia paucivorans]
MGGQFWMDSGELRAIAPEFDRIGNEAEAILQRLHEVVEATGEPWGDDDAGKAFAETYLPDERRALSDLDELTRVLRHRGDDLRAVTAAFEEQDLASARHITEAGSRASAAPLRQDALSLGFGDPSGPVPLPIGAPTTPPPQGSPEPSHRQRSVPPAAHDISSAVHDTSPMARDVEPTPAPGPRPDHAVGRPTHAASADTGTAGTPVVTAGSTTPLPTSRTNTERIGIGLSDRSVASRPGGNPMGRTVAPRPEKNVTPSTGPGDPGRPLPWSPPLTDRKSPRISTSPASDLPPRVPVRPEARPQNRKVELARSSSPESAESVAARLTRELAERHKVRVFGFDTPGVPDEVLTELVAAVDDLLPRYPALRLDAIGIGELPGRNTAHFQGDTRSPRITLATRAATDPECLRQAIAAEEDAGFLAPGCAERPVYSCIVREFGAALDAAGGFRARAMAQRALLTTYLAQAGSHRKRSLHRTVADFRIWRAQLCGRSFRDGRFDPAAALSEAFTGVVMAPDRVTAPVLALHRLLVSTVAESPTAAGRSRTRTEPARCPVPWAG